MDGGGAGQDRIVVASAPLLLQLRRRWRPFNEAERLLSLSSVLTETSRKPEQRTLYTVKRSVHVSLGRIVLSK